MPAALAQGLGVAAREGVVGGLVLDNLARQLPLDHLAFEEGGDRGIPCPNSESVGTLDVRKHSVMNFGVVWHSSDENRVL